MSQALPQGKALGLSGPYPILSTRGDTVASHSEKIAALQKAEAGNELSPNEQFALNELAHEHSSEGARAERVTTGNSSARSWGVLG
jgi:hypothetical protein